MAVPAARFVPHTCHADAWSWVSPAACAGLTRGLRGLADEAAEGLGDDLIPVPGRVLVDHRGTHAGVTQAGHQLFKARAGSG